MPFRALGEQIQLRRREVGISQEDLAEKIEISRTHMGHIEQGRRKPSLELLQKMARVLRVRVKDLIPF
jgi:DNA-binding XRE family transcriptional regulator